MIQIPQLTAVHLHKFTSSGRNRPAIFGCIDSSGAIAGDYVVKLTGSMDTRVRGQASELLGSLLAAHFRILTPGPAIVQIHPELVKWLAVQLPKDAQIIESSQELNFGSQLQTDVATWPVGQMLPETMRAAAANVFAFDALIANDDRRYNNPNVLIRGDNIFVIDHEAAFAFLYLISQREEPWQLRHRTNLQHHVFFFQLRKKALDFRIFTARLAQLSGAELEKIVQVIPRQWRHDDLGRVCAHLQNVRDHVADFERELLEVLA